MITITIIYCKFFNCFSLLFNGNWYWFSHSFPAVYSVLSCQACSKFLGSLPWAFSISLATYFHVQLRILPYCYVLFVSMLQAYSKFFGHTLSTSSRGILPYVLSRTLILSLLATYCYFLGFLVTSSLFSNVPNMKVISFPSYSWITSMYDYSAICGLFMHLHIYRFTLSIYLLRILYNNVQLNEIIVSNPSP